LGTRNERAFLAKAVLHVWRVSAIAGRGLELFVGDQCLLVCRFEFPMAIPGCHYAVYSHRLQKNSCKTKGSLPN
jgi:hypothetical protein